jgi:DNA-binding transcriptional ArsR family regulator
MAPPLDETIRDLARDLAVLGNETRLRLLHRLAEPAFVPDLSRELGMTRQAVARHLNELEAAGLVEARHGDRRGLLPAVRYGASPSGLFLLKERLLGMALPEDAARAAPSLTRPADPGKDAARRGTGLLMVHGDMPGRWFDLAPASEWIVGRGLKAGIQLAYDPYVSLRHAHLGRAGTNWTVTDLHSTNGTSVNFEPLEAGKAADLHAGDMLAFGRTRFVLRGA